MGVCIHQVMVPSPGPVPTPLPHPFAGIFDGALSSDVKVMGQHIPTPPGTSFVTPPNNKATVTMGSTTVKINGKGVARAGDMAETCDEVKVPASIIAVSTVMVG